jgi:PilZ domain
VTDNIYNYGYRLPRFRGDFRLFLQIDDCHSVLLDARCKDLSEAGLAAEISVSLEVGAKVTLILTLPGTSTSMRIAAKVIHHKDQIHGFAFSFSSPSQQLSIHKYLESLHPATVRSLE